MRLGLYLAKSRYVQEHKATDKGFTVELNRCVCGVRVSSVGGPHSTPYKASNRAVPDSFDWWNHGAVLAIKDQGQCGSCWAFSAIGAQESQYKISHGTLQSLSEQNLVDSVTSCYGCG
jgi:cathepsin L